MKTISIYLRQCLVAGTCPALIKAGRSIYGRQVSWLTDIGPGRLPGLPVA